jgi:hypothetical protein
MENKKTCPSDETLTDFLAHRLTSSVREQVENHLAGCAACREQVAMCAELLLTDPAGETAEVSEAVTRQAVDAVLALGPSVKLHTLREGARRWISKGTAALERLVWQPRPAGVAVRGAGDRLAPEPIRREKQFGDLRVTIEIENSGAGQALIRVNRDTGRPAAGPVRVALCMADREAASSLLGHEPVMFEAIPPGIYSLVFALQSGKLGEYAFEIVDLPD